MGQLPNFRKPTKNPTQKLTVSRIPVKVVKTQPADWYSGGSFGGLETSGVESPSALGLKDVIGSGGGFLGNEINEPSSSNPPPGIVTHQNNSVVIK